MKIHINKNEEIRTEKTGLFSKRKYKVYLIEGKYELSETENAILSNNPDILKKILFDYSVEGIEDLDYTAQRTENLINGTTLFSETTQGLMELEQNIKDGAKKLKAHLEAIGNVSTNDSESYEI